MTSEYPKAWFTYFRTDAAFDAAKEAYFSAVDEDPNGAATDALYRAAVAALRKKYAAEEYAETVTAGLESDDLKAAIDELAREAAEARKEAERELKRRRRLSGGVP